jgi:hypothetical protein
MRYCVGDLAFPDFVMPGDMAEVGAFTVGGDRGDVYAQGAAGDSEEGGEGVVVSGAVLVTGREDLDEEEARGLAEEVIWSSYESIGSDTFRSRVVYRRP